MDYWAETMQDDCYLIAADGWKVGAQPREIHQVKNKENKLVWPETHDFNKGKRRFKSDLIPASVLIDRYFATERDAITAVEAELAIIQQQLDEKREEESGEDGLLTEVIEGEGEKQKITVKAVKARLKEIGQDEEFADERQALADYSALLDNQADAKTKLRAEQYALDAKLEAKYPMLSEDEIKSLVVADKWLATLAAAVQGELDRVSETLTGRIREIAERYSVPLPQLTNEVALLATRMDEHLKKMDAAWNLKQAAMQQLLTGQTRLSGLGQRSSSRQRTVFGEFPGDWELTPLSKISSFITKGSTPTTYGFQWVRSGVPFLRSECVAEQGLDLSESVFITLEAHRLLRRSEVRAGDILITITGNVGRVVRLGKDFPSGNINQHIARVRITDDRIAPSFVFHFLSQPAVRKYYSQITTGQAYPQISLAQVRNTVLPIPALEEQTAISAVLSDMDAELVVLEQWLAKARALKQAMMQELLTGKTRLISRKVPHV
jgi:hypothetical protein